MKDIEVRKGITVRKCDENEAEDVKNKLVLCLGFMDENENIRSVKKMHATYNLSSGVEYLKDEQILNTLVDVINEQIKIDIEKGITKELLKDLMKKGVKNENRSRKNSNRVN